jgi:hypothetical protein
MVKTLHPTPYTPDVGGDWGGHTLPPRKTFCRKPYVKPGNSLAVPSLLFIKTTIKNICFYACPLSKMMVAISLSWGFSKRVLVE